MFARSCARARLECVLVGKRTLWVIFHCLLVRIQVSEALENGKLKFRFQLYQHLSFCHNSLNVDEVYIRFLSCSMSEQSSRVLLMLA